MGGLDRLRDGLFTLLFPRLCLGCERAIGADQDDLLCAGCYATLLPTGHWETAENALTDRLAGHFPYVTAAALFTYRAPSLVQRVIHALKYHGRAQIGYGLGRTLGRRLGEQPLLADLAAVVPVPLHPRRQRARGYNQAEVIARGVGEARRLPVRTDLLRRTNFRGSQTKLSRLERMDNVDRSFAAVAGRALPAAAHLLLVDDVITTGATLDACANHLLAAYPGCRLSVAALAVTEH